MSQFIAFLRAINVGGHTVKMDELRRLFETHGFLNVETFIASGNVVFDTEAENTQILEKNIEKLLQEALGYEVATFIRTAAELRDIAEYRPFRQTDMDAAKALNIAFLTGMPDGSAQQKLMGLKTDIDDFHIHDREVYWLCRKKQSESTFSNAVLEKTFGMPSTLRGINTINRIVKKYFSS